MTVQATNYDGSKTYNLAEETDLSKKLNNVTKLYYASKVLQVGSGTVVLGVYTQDELKSLLGVTSDTGFNNKITATAINGAKNSNSANIISCSYEETGKRLIVKMEDADQGSCRVNVLIAYSES